MDEQDTERMRLLVQLVLLYGSESFRRLLNTGCGLLSALVMSLFEHWGKDGVYDSDPKSESLLFQVRAYLNLDEAFKESSDDIRVCE